MCDVWKILTNLVTLSLAWSRSPAKHWVGGPPRKLLLQEQSGWSGVTWQSIKAVSFGGCRGRVSCPKNGRIPVAEQEVL